MHWWHSLFGDFPQFVEALVGQVLFYVGAVLTVTPFIERWFMEPWSKRDRFRLFVLGHIKDLWWIGLCCLLFAFYSAWDQQHRAVDDAINGSEGKVVAWNKFNRCDSEGTALRTTNDTYLQQLSSQRQFLDNQQGIVNACIIALAKNSESAPVNVDTWAIGLGFVKGPAVVTEIVLTTNRQTVVRGELQCDEPFSVADWTLASGGARSNVADNPKAPNRHFLQTLTPPWEPQIPVVVNVFSTKTLSGCKFTPQS